MSEIELTDVEKSFGATPVVKGLSLKVQDGEFFTFVGPSGCGKSTVLNMIAGLEELTSGDIRFDGDSVAALSPRERDVAMVFQSYALYPHMTVYENIAFPLKMKKTPKKEIAPEVERVATLLGLGGMLGKRPSELSGGQRQRVALGRAIVRRPRVFLMDEPLSNLDARLRVEMRAELKRLHRELRITTIYVTHDQAEALSLSDRVAVLEAGRLRQCGTPMEVYSRPADTFVAGFIGSPPMNLLEAEVVSTEPLKVRIGPVELSPEAGRPPKGEKVVLGIRPDDLEVTTSPADGAVEAEVELTELEGAETWIKASLDGLSLKGKISGGRAAAGDKVFLKVPVAKLHLFDAEEGYRL